jgi:predicted Rossmann-fold nucleotide-binding protein
MSKKYIACLGNGKDTAGKMYRKMEEVGKLLAEHNCVVITGGFGGSGMEAPAKGAKSVGGETWGFTMLGKPANLYIDLVFDSSKINIEGRNCSIEEQYGLRLASLLNADGFIIEDTGGVGTLTELCAIINLEEKIWKNKKPIAILVSEQGNLKIMEQIINTFVSNRSYIMVFHDTAKAVVWVTA